MARQVTMSSIKSVPKKGNGSKLTEKQRRFIHFYLGESVGNAYDAAKRAGYRGNYATLRAIGQENLTKPIILEEIERRRGFRAPGSIATREERESILTNFLRDPEVKHADRLRAAEILAKMSGDFIERRQVDLDDRREKREQEITKQTLETTKPELLDSMIADIFNRSERGDDDQASDA